MTHTPTPWFVSDWNNDFGDEPFMVHSQENEIIRAGQSGIWPGGIIKTAIANTEECDGDRVANAAFIVKAVNAHEGLVAALRDVLGRMENHDAWWIDSPNKGGFDRDMIEAALEGLE